MTRCKNSGHEKWLQMISDNYKNINRDVICVENIISVAYEP